VRGRSSLTTTQVRTHDKFMPFDYRGVARRREGRERREGGRREGRERREETRREEKRGGRRRGDKEGGEERKQKRRKGGKRRERERRGVTKKIFDIYIQLQYSHDTHTLRVSVLLPSSRQQMSRVA